MAFYREKNMEFKLVTEEEREDFTIWPIYKADKTDPYYQQFSFPLRESHQLKDGQGKVHEVSDLKWMKSAEFNAKFPKLGRNYKVIRTIIVEGEEYAYAFTRTSNEKLKSHLKTLKAAGQDLTRFVFKQTFNGTKSPSEMYGLDLVEAQTSTQPTPENNTAPVIKPSIKLDDGLSDDERRLMTAIKKETTKFDEERFIQVHKTNFADWKKEITDERINELWKIYSEEPK